MRTLRLWSAVAALTFAASQPALAQDAVNLRFFTNFDANVQKQWEPILEQYEQEHPGTKVEMETVAGSGAAIYPDVLRTSMAAGDPPDVYFMWGGEIAGPFIDAGQVLELGEYYDKYGWQDRFPEWVVDRISRNGGVYGVPYNARGMSFWYRTDIFAEHGIEEPQSIDELEQVCAKLKENDINCASAGGKFGWHPMRLLDTFIEVSCGPEKHDQLNRLEASWDEPCVVAAYERMRKWVENEWLVPDFLNVTPADARMPVYLGTAAMIIEGDWFEGVVRGDGQSTDNLDFFLLPTGHEPLRFSAFPQQWMIAEGSGNHDAAAAFIDWITTAEVQQQHKTAFVATAVKGVEPDCAEWPISCKWKKLITSDAQTFPPTDQAFTKELMDSFFEVQDGIIAGRISPADGAALMQERAAAWKAEKGKQG